MRRPPQPPRSRVEDLRRENEAPRARLSQVLSGPEGPARTADILCRGILEQMQAAAVALDGAGTILYANACFADLMRMDRDALLGTSIFLLVPDDARSFFSPLEQ